MLECATRVSRNTTGPTPHSHAHITEFSTIVLAPQYTTAVYTYMYCKFAMRVLYFDMRTLNLPLAVLCEKQLRGTQGIGICEANAGYSPRKVGF